VIPQNLSTIVDHSSLHGTLPCRPNSTAEMEDLNRKGGVCVCLTITPFLYPYPEEVVVTYESTHLTHNVIRNNSTNSVYQENKVQSPVKVTDKTLGARKDAKNAKDQEHL
jgi:hypothetical protein